MVTWPAVVSAIASAIAATMALLTTMRAVVLERERSRDRAAETRADYFKALLTKPLSREADKLTRLIQTRAKELVRALGKTAVIAERDALVQETIDEIREGFISLHHELRVATGAWQDDEIKQRLFRETQDWEDQTQLTVAALLAPGKGVDEARKACTAYRTALRRILFDADPLLLRDRERQDRSKGALERYFRGV